MTEMQLICHDITVYFLLYNLFYSFTATIIKFKYLLAFIRIKTNNGFILKYFVPFFTHLYIKQPLLT